ncbi:MAG: CAP domain-containing protein [Rubrivivax sp.]|nr:CAP domain-containing protein [Rubrivivax sp.]
MSRPPRPGLPPPRHAPAMAVQRLVAWAAAGGLLMWAGTPCAQVAEQRGPAEPPSKGGFVLDAPGPGSTNTATAATAATAAPASPAPAAPSAAAPAAALPPATKALLEEINRRRAEGATCGTQRMAPAPPVGWSDLLHRAADAHVRDMAPQRGDSIGHTGSNGSSVGQRVDTAGYRWRSVGENVAAGRPTASATLAQWMASPGHCSNIMSPGFAEVAVAGLHLPGSTYGHYWVMVLARPF